MTRAPVKLSREMKMLLMLLLMVALVGLWYVWDSNRNAGNQAVVQPPVTPPVTTPVPKAPTGTASKPTTGQSSTSNPTGSAVPVQGGDQTSVAVEKIPPFPTDGTASTTPKDKPVKASSGINPEATLASVPSNNPFRPLNLDRTTAGASAAPTNTSTPVSSPAVAQTPVSTSSSTPTTNMTAIGPGGISAPPGADGSSQVTSGASPISIPGADGSPGSTSSPTASANPSTTTPTVRPIPVNTSVVTTPANPAGSTGSTGSNGANPISLTPAAPVKPPIAGVQVPNVTSLPSGTPATPATNTGSANSSTSTANPSATAPTTLPSTSNPQVITELGQGSGATQASTNPLDQYVQDNQLAFNAVVLGPINTAIFKGKDGFVVASVGQTLPDSKVVVKAVTATSATLSLGNDIKTIEMDKR